MAGKLTKKKYTAVIHFTAVDGFDYKAADRRIAAALREDPATRSASGVSFMYEGGGVIEELMEKDVEIARFPVSQREELWELPESQRGLPPISQFINMLRRAKIDTWGVSYDIDREDIVSVRERHAERAKAIAERFFNAS